MAVDYSPSKIAELEARLVELVRLRPDAVDTMRDAFERYQKVKRASGRSETEAERVIATAIAERLLTKLIAEVGGEE